MVSGSQPSFIKMSDRYPKLGASTLGELLACVPSEGSYGTSQIATPSTGSMSLARTVTDSSCLSSSAGSSDDILERLAYRTTGNATYRRKAASAAARVIRGLSPASHASQHGSSYKRCRLGRSHPQKAAYVQPVSTSPVQIVITPPTPVEESAISELTAIRPAVEIPAGLSELPDNSTQVSEGKQPENFHRSAAQWKAHATFLEEKLEFQWSRAEKLSVELEKMRCLLQSKAEAAQAAKATADRQTHQVSTLSKALVQLALNSQELMVQAGQQQVLSNTFYADNLRLKAENKQLKSSSSCLSASFAMNSTSGIAPDTRASPAPVNPASSANALAPGRTATATPVHTSSSRLVVPDLPYMGSSEAHRPLSVIRKPVSSRASFHSVPADASPTVLSQFSSEYEFTSLMSLTLHDPRRL
jgi:hypothetical protein